MKMRGNFDEISFQAKFCRNLFALLLHNTVANRITTKDIYALPHTSNITLDCTLTTTGDFHPSYFWSNSLLRGRMFIRLSDGESQKLKCAKIPLNFRKGKLGTVKVNV